VTSRLPGLQNRGQRLMPGHRRKPQAVLRDAGHGGLQSLERREIILAQRDQAPGSRRARSRNASARRLVLFEPRLEFLRRPILDQIGKPVDEARGARASEVIALRQRE
jgi:hypothetical protein